ncbi:MAG TPA: FmdB family zinc ribbon protein [Chloroflexia bacterium]|nr:FmdB family zinc ribbon protein [Chloroflexia bacterium]
MPTYEYECRSCAQRFDRVQSFNDEPVRVCPHCGGETRRVIQAVGVVFKGSGWYINDSRKPAASETTTKSDGDGAKPKSDDKAEATPAAKDTTSESASKAEPAAAPPKASSSDA